MAPKEGAIAWVDGLSLIKAAKNIDQAYAFLNFLMTPEFSANVAEGSGYNPVIKGADALLSDAGQEDLPGSVSRATRSKNLWPVAARADLVRRDPQPVCGQVQGGLNGLTRQICRPRPIGRGRSICDGTIGEASWTARRNGFYRPHEHFPRSMRRAG